MITGVVLFLFDPLDRVLLIRELSSKPNLGKYAGQFSVPMETVHDGESPNEAIKRLVLEEIGENISVTADHFRDFTDIIPDVRLVVYKGRCDGAFVAQPTDTDITYEGWMCLPDILALNAGSKRLGVDRIIREYLESISSI